MSTDNRVGDHLSNLHANFTADDEGDVLPETPTTEISTVTIDNTPAIITKAMVDADPDWHIVSNLHGNMSAAIRKLGKAVFKELTTTPVDKITVVANLGGQGPNSKREIDAIGAFLKKK